MAGNSRSELLARLEGVNVTQGWGAVSVLSRARLNRSLEQQYLSRLQDLTFLPPCSLELSLPDRQISLVSVEFGTPMLSFETASLSDSFARLSMNVISGQVVERTRGGVLLRQHDLSESMGYTLEMVIELAQVNGIVEQRGRVVLDLANGARFSCNLLSGAAAQRLATRLESWFSALPRHRTLFDLGIIDYQGISPLTPESFVIRTQAAPGATLLGGNNYGAGAVVVFIRLLGNDAPGWIPGTDFPYLIPDDDDGERYSATLVVQEGLLGHATDGRLDVLSSLLFPAKQMFTEIDRAKPSDLIIFGDIVPHRSLLTVTPATKTIRAGEQVQFKLLDANGNELQAARWSAVSLRSHLQRADGTFVPGTPGLYQAADEADIGQELLTVVITAEHTAGSVTHLASARVLVHHQALSFSPALHVGRLDDGPVALRAARSNNGGLSWQLLKPELGRLHSEAGQARFEADPALARTAVALQQVVADQDAKVRAGIVLRNGRQPVRLESAEEGGLKPGQQRTFKHEDTTWLPDAERRWRVLGNGTLSAQGLYTAPGDVRAGTDVVALEFVQNGVSYPGGDAVLTVSDLEAEDSWTALSKFTLTLTGGQGSKHEGGAYANGYQQLQVDITVAPVQPTEGDKIYRLSSTEVATIRLRDRASGTDVGNLDESAEGLEASEQQSFATRRTPNRFRKPRQAIADLNTGALADPDQGVTYQKLFLHSLYDTGVSYEFYAVLDKDGGGEFRSTANNQDNVSFQFLPVGRPTFRDDHYTVSRHRVQGGSAAPGDPEEDDFDFHLRTQDYFNVQYQMADFELCDFYWLDDRNPDLPVIPPSSLLLWESTYKNEIMASFTGWIFRDRLEKKEKDGPPPLEIQFDSKLEEYAKSYIEDFNTTVDNTVFKTGALTIVNFRHDNYNYDETAANDIPQAVGAKLVDQDGNTHYLQVAYGAASKVGRRNRIDITVQQSPALERADRRPR